jgi:replicative DNA helicase
MKLSAPIFRLKRQAKARAREARIPLVAALNRIAEEEGFRSWSELAARHEERDPAAEILTRLEQGDMVLIGARPMQGKTALALKILAAACKAGRPGFFFTLEYTKAEAWEKLRSFGLELDSERVCVDTSDAICADYMVEKLRGAHPGAVIVVDYLQALDQRRENPPLSGQIAALSEFARRERLIFVFISQIDRHYDAAGNALPGIADVRLPNKVDLSIFTKTCFLREGEVVLSGAKAA